MMDLRRKGKKKKSSADKLGRRKKDDPAIEEFQYLKFIAKDFLSELGHPNRIIYENTNETISMKKILKDALKKFRYKDAILFKLYLEYGKEIKSSSIYLAKVWDEVNKRQIDPKDLEIFRNLEFFVEFLVKNNEIDLLRKFNAEVKTQIIKEEEDYEIVEED